ncbi:hypothetical protein BDZ94DRAFT_1264458 [Collybia nuda]|uniref:Uncharacterized protein n=1 Tax=Collybia nuda TaxID=64659 RepID=A0A9P6CCY9_9AGAR|nr:hypothetical protein BDZ94DRAFT_1264458 [Collybia nuda]
MSLHTTDNGATWRAQHAIVEDVMYNAVEYLTQDGERRSGVVARSRREPISNFIAWVREGVEV